MMPVLFIGHGHDSLGRGVHLAGVGIARHERDRDSVVGLFAPEQPVGIEQAEREPDDRRDRRERDVALGEIQAQAEHFASFVESAADHAGVRQRGCVGTGTRGRQRKAGHFLALRQARLERRPPKARALLRRGGTTVVRRHLTRDLGMCCGGEMAVFLEVIQGEGGVLVPPGAGACSAKVPPSGGVGGGSAGRPADRARKETKTMPDKGLR